MRVADLPQLACVHTLHNETQKLSLRLRNVALLVPQREEKPLRQINGDNNEQTGFERVCCDGLRDDYHAGTRLDRRANQFIRRMFEHDAEVLRTDSKIWRGRLPSLVSEDCGSVSVDGERAATI
jgi:hypothetical protein